MMGPRGVGNAGEGDRLGVGSRRKTESSAAQGADLWPVHARGPLRAPLPGERHFASGVALRAERHGEPGEKVIVYLDHVGRLEGVVARTLPDGFALAIHASERKRDKLAAQLIWLANKEKFGLPEDRRHQRVTPRKSVSELVTGDGQRHPCRIIDLSLSGAAVETETRPTLGAAVALGTM